MLFSLHECVEEVRVIKLKASGSEDRGACCIKQTSTSKQLFWLCFMEDSDFKQILMFCTGCQSQLVYMMLSGFSFSCMVEFWSQQRVIS